MGSESENRLRPECGSTFDSLETSCAFTPTIELQCNVREGTIRLCAAADTDHGGIFHEYSMNMMIVPLLATAPYALTWCFQRVIPAHGVLVVHNQFRS